MTIDELNTPFLPTSIIIPEEEDRLSVFLVDILTDTTYALNNKTIGIFSSVEKYNGENWNYGSTTAQVKKVRNGFQIIIYIPSLPNTNILELDQTIRGINENFIMTLCYGTASQLVNSNTSTPGDYFSFMNKGDSRISFTISDTQVIITTTTDLSTYQAYIVMEYIKAGN